MPFNSFISFSFVAKRTLKSEVSFSNSLAYVSFSFYSRASNSGRTPATTASLRESARLTPPLPVINATSFCIMSFNRSTFSQSCLFRLETIASSTTTRLSRAWSFLRSNLLSAASLCACALIACMDFSSDFILQRY